ncbi:MAG: hypothetical protein IT232_09015 [Flavobacteriales bacterium]|nr:hypothetical protein [Flavobacteriales bacterium]
MTTITLKINDNTAMGKSFLAFLKNLVAKDKSVEIVTKEEKNRYNTETEKAINEARAGKNLIKAKNVDELFKKLRA